MDRSRFGRREEEKKELFGETYSDINVSRYIEDNDMVFKHIIDDQDNEFVEYG
jgi:hypothetical protein